MAQEAVLAFNDSGWDLHGFALCSGGRLETFDTLGMVQTEEGELRPVKNNNGSSSSEYMALEC